PGSAGTSRTRSWTRTATPSGRRCRTTFTSRGRPPRAAGASGAPGADATRRAAAMTRWRALVPWIERARMPAAVLVALLQRAPAVRMAAAAAEAAEAPIGAVVRAGAVAAAALGAVDSVAGATQYSLSTGTPGHPSPYTVAEGSQIAAVAFALISNPQVTNPPQSWTVMGQIPPGLLFGDPHNVGNTITSPGYINFQTPALFGAPTAPGTYTMVLQAWEYQGGTGLFSSTFTYEVIVTSNVTPTPTPTPTPNPDGPVFATQPLSVTVTGGTVALDAAASNSPAYQWMLNGTTPVNGATGPILLLGNAAAAAGTYTCVATNAAG